MSKNRNIQSTTRTAVVYQSVDPKAKARRSQAKHFLTQQVCWDRFMALQTHLAQDYVAPTSVQRHKMRTNAERNIRIAAAKAAKQKASA